MKNGLFLSLAAATLLTGLAACSNDTEEAIADSSTIRVTGSVIDNAVTRAASNLQGDKLTKGLQVGLFADANGVADNAVLTVADDLTTLTPTADLKWPATGDVNFYAYAPYDATNTGKISSTIDFAVADDQSDDDAYVASDLLFGVPSTNPVTNGNSVALVFKHQLAKVIVKLTATEAAKVKLSSPSISLLNVVKGVKMNVKTGTTANVEGTGTVKVHAFGADASTFECAAIIAPQTITSGKAFIQVENDGKTYNCSLGSDKELKAGNAYVFNVSFDGEAASVESSNNNLTDWNAEENGTDTEAPAEVVQYGVGDYLLADGTLVKSSSLSADQSPIGVIFSTEVSATDAQAGYTAYILGLKTLTSAKPQAGSTALTLAEDYTALTTLEAEIADLDGLSHTQYVQSLSDYTTNYPLYDLSSISDLADNNSFSGWFIPSMGQFVQILKNLGGVSIPSSTSYAYYCVMPNYTYSEEKITFSGKNFLFASSPKLSEVISALKTATNNTSVITASRYATATLVKYNNANETALMDFSSSFMSTKANGTGDDLTDSDKSEAWGISSGSSNNANARSRIAVIATKLALSE